MSVFLSGRRLRCARDEMLAIADPNARENGTSGCASRILVAAGTVESAYLLLFGAKEITVPPSSSINRPGSPVQVLGWMQ